MVTPPKIYLSYIYIYLYVYRYHVHLLNSRNPVLYWRCTKKYMGQTDKSLAPAATTELKHYQHVGVNVVGFADWFIGGCLLGI